VLLQAGNFTGYPLIRRTLTLKFETILMKNSLVTFLKIMSILEIGNYLWYHGLKV